MIVQCSQCRRIRVDGVYRLPYPEEIEGDVADVFCPRCARIMIARIRAGEFVTHEETAARKAAN